MESDGFKMKIFSFLIPQGWLENECLNCHRTFLSKNPAKVCGDYDCSKEYSFDDYVDHRNIGVRELVEKTYDYFLKKDFTIANRGSVLNDIGDTSFVMAGIQYFDDIIHHDAPMRCSRYLVPQPVIRTNYLERVGKEDGFSTSFVNLCTEQAKTNFSDFQVHLNVWLEYFSVLKLDIRKVIIIVEDKVWKGGVLQGRSILFNYGGIELGDAIYIKNVPQNTRPSLDIVDFSFGLERILWAINFGKSYYVPIGSEFADPLLNDLVKSSVLMIISGVFPSAKKQGRVLRKFIKFITKNYGLFDMTKIVSFHFQYWSLFITPIIDYKNSYSIFEAELKRNLIENTL